MVICSTFLFLCLSAVGFSPFTALGLALVWGHGLLTLVVVVASVGVGLFPAFCSQLPPIGSVRFLLGRGQIGDRYALAQLFDGAVQGWVVGVLAGPGEFFPGLVGEGRVAPGSGLDFGTACAADAGADVGRVGRVE